MLVIFILCLFPLLCEQASAQSEGYALRDKEYVTETKAHWEAWKLVRGTAVMDESGMVRPYRFRRNIDAIANSDQFVHQMADPHEFPFRRLWEKGLGTRAEIYIAPGGAKNAGSNLYDTRNVVDGDPNTFWQPHPADKLEDWWIEIDLGRLAAATKIVLRFVGSGLGDSFHTFRVSTSRGEPAVRYETPFAWRTVFNQRLPEDRRTYEIELHPSAAQKDPRSAGLGQYESGEYEGVGNAIQYVRVQATSRTDKGREVPRAEYETLSVELRGAREYFKKTETGKVRQISQEAYEALPLKQRGMVRYYVKPQPRIADVEVWTIGDNVALGLLDRGGSVDNPATSQPISIRALVDGSYISYREVFPRADVPVELVVDLGATYWVDRIRMLNHYVPQLGMYGLPIQSYRLDGSDGTRTASGELAWEVLSSDEKTNIPGGLRRTEDSFDLRRLRYLHLQIRSTIISRFVQGKGHVLQEIQVFGEGYAPEVTLESPLIEHGRSIALSKVRWEGEFPPGTEIQIRTRTGDTLEETKRYFDVDGQEITERQWYKLPGFLRTPPEIGYVPGPDWSPWSAAYQKSGDLASSPSPRKYLQFQVHLVSDDPERYATIRSLAVGFFTPLVQEATAEMHPWRLTGSGVRQTFSAWVRYTCLPFNFGFDGLLIRCSHEVDMRFGGIRVGDEEDFAAGDAEWVPPETLNISQGTDFLRIGLPRVIRPVGKNLMEIHLEGTVFLKGTQFEIFLTKSDMPESLQRVIAGDATSSVNSQRMTVMVPVDRRAIGELSIESSAFTPNGDGVNDVLEISFPVFNVYPPKPAEAVITDLHGRIHRRLADEGTDAEGFHVVHWDGRGETGHPVPPGIYLVRVLLDADAREATRTAVCGIVSVVY